MNYKLNNKNKANDKENVLKVFFKNRDVDDYQAYLNLNDDAVLSYDRLSMIYMARDILCKHLEANNKIAILCDEDVDGFTSASEIYLYLQSLCSSYGFESEINYMLHQRHKTHGLTSRDFTIPDHTKLLIVPDAGTNDIKECNRLIDKGIDIIILDHHEFESHPMDKHLQQYIDNLMNGKLAVVNNQISIHYPNKQLCGAGVVYKFLKCLDDKFIYTDRKADDLLDLCALGNISDMMDIRSPETKILIDKGLNNIHNRCFKSLCESQDYSMNGEITIHNIQWYISPIINGMIRFGEMDEKDLLFRAFIETDEMFEYKKRATKKKPASIIKETVYERAARLCKNAKSRQDRAKVKIADAMIEIAETECKDNKVAIIDATGMNDPRITGLVAMQCTAKLHKPCLIVQKNVSSKDNIAFMSGSARNMRDSVIPDLKALLRQTGQFNFLQGHKNAFGVGFTEDKLPEINKSLNQLLKDVEFSSVFTVDFIFSEDEINPVMLRELCSLDAYTGQGLPESLFALKNVIIDTKRINLCGAKFDTMQFDINETQCIMFRCNDKNKLYRHVCDMDNCLLVCDFVCKATTSVYQGKKQYQIEMMDVEVKQTTMHDDDGWDDNDDGWD